MCPKIYPLFLSIIRRLNSQLGDSMDNPQENLTSTNSSTTSKNQNQRYITAAILLALLGVILFFHHPLLIWSSLGICFALGFKESLALFDIKPSFYLYSFAAILWILSYFNASPILSGVFGAMILASLLAYKRSLAPKTLFPFIYPTLPFLALWGLYSKMGDFSISCIVWLIVIVAFTDTGAYYGGKAFGRTPFSETSPNKTLEGAGIGITLGIIGGSLIGIGPSGGFIPSLLISIGVSVASVFGDLFESYLKRESGVKDSGKILPGHGGILDRFDGILFGAITMYYLLGFIPMWQQL